VRGVWQPAGHLGGYYLSHDQAARAVTLAEESVSTAAALGAPDPAQRIADRAA
jgi:hypothetical protein